MIKKAFLLIFISFCILLAYPFFSKKPIEEIHQHPLNALLEQKLQGLYPDPHPTPLSKLWQPALEDWGLTYDLDAVAVLRGEKFIDKDKAEERFAEVYIEYQKKLNSIPQIRPFLAEFPISPKSFFLSTKFKTLEGSFFNAPYLAAIGPLPNDTIYFCVQTPESQENQKTIAEKRIEESEFLKSCYKPFVERTQVDSKEINIPSLHEETLVHPLSHSIFFFANTFSSRHHLFPLALGNVGRSDGKHSSFAFALWGQEQLLLEAAHKMAAECARDFLLFLQKDKAALGQMKEQSKDVRYCDPATIPEPRHMTFRISLWDEGINRQPAPYIAEIRLQDGVFEYFTSDKGQNLIPLYSESFDDAMRFLETDVSNEPKETKILRPSAKIKHVWPEDILAIRLDKELANFHSGDERAHPVRMWLPALSRGDFTQSFEPFEILTGVKFSDPGDAEKKYVDIFREYQNKLNSIPYIRPFLWEFPLTPNTIQLEVGLRDETNEPWPSNLISAILPDPKGSLNFLAYAPFETPEPKQGGGIYQYFPPHRDVYKSVLSKPLEKVESLASCFSPFVPRSPIPEHELEILSLSYIPLGSDTDRAVATFLQAFTKQQHLIPLLSSYSDPSAKNMVFSFAACGRQKQLLAEARLLAATCAHEWLEFLKKDKVVLEAMKKRNNEVPTDFALIPQPRHLNFRISFWDGAINRQSAPYIAEIRFVNSTFFYFTADEGQRLVPVFQETYDDTMKFLQNN